MLRTSTAFDRVDKDRGDSDWLDQWVGVTTTTTLSSCTLMLPLGPHMQSSRRSSQVHLQLLVETKLIDGPGEVRSSSSLRFIGRSTHHHRLLLLSIADGSDGLFVQELLLQEFNESVAVLSGVAEAQAHSHQPY